MKTCLMTCILLCIAVVASAGTDETKVIDATTGMEFVFAKGGCFKMGDTVGDGEPDEKPVHEVCVSDFYLGKYEVTQKQWEKVMGSNPSAHSTCGPDCPVDSVSWNMAQEYITKLNAASGKHYRLPTEAEWEYAARSGGKDEKWAGTSDSSKLQEYAWYYELSSGPQQVGLKKANGLGVHDMSGNNWEWCQDWYSATYYEGSPKNNPAGPDKGEKRVLRGGGWLYPAEEARVSFRKKDEADIGDANYGLRLLLTSP